MNNICIMQFFEWNVPNDGAHWLRLQSEVPALVEKGIGLIWIPPCAKAAEQGSVGYDVYDLYDLGEFDQKGSVRTKYGTLAQLKDAIEAAHASGMKIIADVVLNHKSAADATERFTVVEVDENDRTLTTSEPFEIEGWTKFDFLGRANRYSSFTWNHTHFSAVDRDELANRSAIFRIVGEGKAWSEDVDTERGNFDYLMSADIDYHNVFVQEEIKAWALWFIDKLKLDGFRMDAVKHFDQRYIKALIDHVRENRDPNFFVVGEYWNGDQESLNRFIDASDQAIQLFDVSLHYRFAEAAQKGREYNLASLFDDTLIATNPFRAVTFVDNHDSQPGESLESWVDDWFKPLAYALILLRREGLPCVFYGDYYGIMNGPEPKKKQLDPLLLARKYLAYGEQYDYFDHPNVVGFTRLGDEEHPDSGLAVLISNGEEGIKQMCLGDAHAGEVYWDITNNRTEQILLDASGSASFIVNGGSVSVWVNSIWQGKLADMLR